MDAAIEPAQEEDQQTTEAEIPVSVDSLAIGDTAPEVGDHVTIKVEGSVTRIVNGQAYVRPDTVNDQPLEKPMIKPDPMQAEGDRLRKMSMMSDSQGASDY